MTTAANLVEFVGQRGALRAQAKALERQIMVKNQRRVAATDDEAAALTREIAALVAERTALLQKTSVVVVADYALGQKRHREDELFPTLAQFVSMADVKRQFFHDSDSTTSPLRLVEERISQCADLRSARLADRATMSAIVPFVARHKADIRKHVPEIDKVVVTDGNPETSLDVYHLFLTRLGAFLRPEPASAAEVSAAAAFVRDPANREMVEWVVSGEPLPLSNEVALAVYNAIFDQDAIIKKMESISKNIQAIRKLVSDDVLGELTNGDPGALGYAVTVNRVFFAVTETYSRATAPFIAVLRKHDISPTYSPNFTTVAASINTRMDVIEHLREALTQLGHAVSRDMRAPAINTPKGEAFLAFADQAFATHAQPVLALSRSIVEFADRMRIPHAPLKTDGAFGAQLRQFTQLTFESIERLNERMRGGAPMHFMPTDKKLAEMGKRIASALPRLWADIKRMDALTGRAPTINETASIAQVVDEHERSLARVNHAHRDLREQITEQRGPEAVPPDRPTTSPEDRLKFDLAYAKEAAVPIELGLERRQLEARAMLDALGIRADVKAQPDELTNQVDVLKRDLVKRHATNMKSYSKLTSREWPRPVTLEAAASDSVAAFRELETIMKDVKAVAKTNKALRQALSARPDPALAKYPVVDYERLRATVVAKIAANVATLSAQYSNAPVYDTSAMSADQLIEALASTEAHVATAGVFDSL